MMDPSYYYNYDKNSNKLRKHAIFVTSGIYNILLIWYPSIHLFPLVSLVTTLALTLAATIVAVISKSSATYAFAVSIKFISCLWQFHDFDMYLS